MSFIETIERARALLKRNGRLSLRALKREFVLTDDALADLVDELVDVQHVAAREGKLLSWIGTGPEEPSAAEAETRAISEVSLEGAQGAQTAEAERRQLTVLFCDLIDSTRLAAGLDPEDWREVVCTYQEAAATVVERFDGYVAQYLGDGLLVYFGWPNAHEHDAERAVRAGLGIAEALAELNTQLETDHDLRLAVRVGIHTGPVVVGEMGRGASREILAMGDTTNVAAHLQGIAEPDTIVLSAATLRLVSGIFVTRDLGERDLKGVREPVHVYQAVRASGVSSRLDVARGSLTRFVGREQELGILIDRWEQAVEGDGQTVFLSGEAGLGKSRLVLVLREHLGSQAHTWLECRSSPYTAGSALYPVTELVAQGLAFGEGDGPETRLGKLRDGLTAAGLEAERAVPLVAHLLDVPLGPDDPPLRLSPERQRERTFETLVAWLLAMSEVQPVLLHFEDLHWCDPSSLELFGRLIEQIPTSRVLLVLTARPEFEVPWTHPKNWTPIALGKLRQRCARELILSLSPEGSLPEQTVSQIVERADGVPLYLEELTRASVESEATGAAIAIPATLQDSLMSRLDRISAAKEIAQVASVLGREIEYRLLEPVAGLDETTLRQGLATLTESELLFQRGTPPEATYTFKHALIQETAYESVLRRRRQEIHARIANVIESRFPERAETEPEVVARHHEEGGRSHEAATWYRRAGERATRRSAHAEAIAHVKRGIELLQALPVSALRDTQELQLQLALGAPLTAARGWGSAEVGETYARARELAVRVDADPQLTDSLISLGAHHQVRGDLATALGFREQSLSIAERSGDTFPLLVSHGGVGQALYFLGRFVEAQAHLDRAIELYDPAEHGSLGHLTGNDEGVVPRAFASWCLWTLGYPERSVRLGHGAIELARQVEHPFALAHALVFMARTRFLRREYEQTRQLAEEAIALSTDLGFPLYLGVATALRGAVLAHSGVPDEAVQQIQEALAQLATTETGVGAAYFLCLLAEAQCAGGQWNDAWGALQVATAMVAQSPQPFHDAELRRLEGETLIGRGAEGSEPDAEARFLEGLAIARSQGARSFELRAATSLARLWRRQGRRDDAYGVLAPIYDWFGEGFDTQDLQDAKALLEEWT